jgi:hypothetical protein
MTLSYCVLVYHPHSGCQADGTAPPPGRESKRPIDRGDEREAGAAGAQIGGIRPGAADSFIRSFQSRSHRRKLMMVNPAWGAGAK